ncbi:MAG TPA: histidine phosphatase family protein [Mycobacterium sp.]|nr:histidine phosphatase family protein [Mycobacterium sp.]
MTAGTQRERTLLLMRHAKSAYPPGVRDHDRPLAPRGIREAKLAGEWLRGHLPEIDAVLCSTATRARDTLSHAGVTAPVAFCERLYDAVPGTVVEVINGADDWVGTLLVIGHEPALAQVSLGLASAHDSNQTAAEQISTKFPTSAIAVLRSGTPWHSLELGGASLTCFHVPR